MRQKLEAYEEKKADFRLGGDPDEVQRQHDQGKMTARERVEALLDPGSFGELDLLLTTADGISGQGSGKRSVSGALLDWLKHRGR